jgi:hypothetical protein
VFVKVEGSNFAWAICADPKCSTADGVKGWEDLTLEDSWESDKSRYEFFEAEFITNSFEVCRWHAVESLN